MVWWPGIVRTRSDFVNDQFMRVADNKHFYRQYANVVQLIGQALRHLPCLLLHVGTQPRGDDGISKDTVFVDIFGGVEGLHVFIVQTAYDHGNFAAQIHHFFQNTIHAAVFGKRGFEFIQCFYADLAFAVVAQSGSFQDAGQKLYAFFSDVFGFANCLIRRGLQACFAYPCLFLNAVLRDGNAVAAGRNVGMFSRKRIASALTFSNSVVTAAHFANSSKAAWSSNGAHKWRSANSAAGAFGSGVEDGYFVCPWFSAANG